MSPTTYAAHALEPLSSAGPLAVSPGSRAAVVEGEQGRRLAPLILAGSWSELMSRATARRSRRSRAARTPTSRAISRSGPPGRRARHPDGASVARCPGRRLGPRLRADRKTTLNQFHDVAPHYLSRPITLDVPAERRFMASVVSEPRTSPRLRQGIARTRWRSSVDTSRTSVSTTGPRATARPARRPCSYRARQCRSTGRAWQSLADVLHLLAEAAPDAFLDAQARRRPQRESASAALASSTPS